MNTDETQIKKKSPILSVKICANQWREFFGVAKDVHHRTSAPERGNSDDYSHRALKRSTS